MKKLLMAVLLFSLLPYYGLSQINAKEYFIKLSSRRVLFGTGDIAGFSVSVEGAKNILKAPKQHLINY